MTIHHLLARTSAALLIFACGATASAANLPTVTGRLTYDFVPVGIKATSEGDRSFLDFAKTVRKPIRQALVELVSADDETVLSSTYSGTDGSYSLDLPATTDVYVRVKSQAQDGSGGMTNWTYFVRDNTDSTYASSHVDAALYSIRSESFNAGGSSKRNLHAASGWTGKSYGATRAAAPFAILDTVEGASMKLIKAAPEVSIPPLHIFWSPKNTRKSGEPSAGEIGTSHLGARISPLELYLLGDEDEDTDEFDTSIVLHEFGHFVQHALSQADGGVAGTHLDGEYLDMRLAFGEGWGNAFSSMMRDSPIYTDSSKPNVAMGAIEDFGSKIPPSPEAWMGESAIANILYKLYKAPGIGLVPLYRTMLNEQKNTPAMSSIFSFVTGLRAHLDKAGLAQLDSVLASIGLPTGDRLDEWGTNQVVPKGLDIAPEASRAVLPIFNKVVNGTAVACTTAAFGKNNKLGSFAHLGIPISKPGVYRIVIKAESPERTEDFALSDTSLRGVPLTAVSDDADNTFNFATAGDYTADIWHETSIDKSTGKGAHCATVSVEPAID